MVMLWGRLLCLQFLILTDSPRMMRQERWDSDQIFSTKSDPLIKVRVPCCNIDLAYVEEHWQELKSTTGDGHVSTNNIQHSTTETQDNKEDWILIGILHWVQEYPFCYTLYHEWLGFNFWHEQSAFQLVSVRVGRLWLVATINIIIFSFFSLRHLLFSWKECSDQKSYQRKLLKTAINLGFDTFPDPVCHFGFCRRCGSAALQAVSECPLRRQAGIQRYCQLGPNHICGILSLRCDSIPSL